MKRLLSGSCHCKRVKFEIQADINHVRVCDCSICHKRGALIHRVEQEDFKLLTAWEDLSVYQWGTMTAKDYFCSACGILPFRKPSDLTPEEIKKGMQPFHGWAINARCLEGIDVSKLQTIGILGSEM